MQRQSSDPYGTSSQRFFNVNGGIGASLSGVGTGFNLTTNDIRALTRQYTQGNQDTVHSDSGNTDNTATSNATDHHDDSDTEQIDATVLQRQISTQQHGTASTGTKSPPPTSRDTSAVHPHDAQSHDDGKTTQQIQHFLDPDDDTDLFDVIPTWSIEQVQQFIDTFEPHHYPVIVSKLRSRRNKNDEKGSFQKLLDTSTLAWRHLTHARGSDVLLDNIDGYMRPGMMIGVLGAPDAGATTLFDILAGRMKDDDEHSSTTGTITLGGRPIDSTLKRKVGYVVKSDVNFAIMTVYETLYFSAAMRQPTNTKHSMLHLIVCINMKLLGLYHVKDSIVGDGSTRGVSGGERRRVSYGCELVAGARLIIADLPTNGLDSTSSLNLLKHFQTSTLLGNALLASVVQPSEESYNVFTHILLLCKGKSIYFGPTVRCLEHIEAQGFVRPKAKSTPQFLEELSASPEQFWTDRNVPVPVKQRPLVLSSNEMEGIRKRFQITDMKEWNRILKMNGSSVHIHQDDEDSDVQPTTSDTDSLIQSRNQQQKQVVTEEFDKTEDEDHNARWLAAARLQTGFHQSVYYEDVGWMLFHDRRSQQEKMAKHKTPWHASQEKFRAKYSLSFARQTWYCIDRQYKLVIRNLGLWLFNFIRSVIMGAIVGTLFGHLGTDQAAIRSRFGLMFFIISYSAGAANQLVSVFSQQRQVVQNQFASNYNHPAAYLLALEIVFLPVVVVETFLFVIMVYPLVGLANGVNSTAFGFLFLMAILINLTARAFVILLSCVLNSQAAVQSLSGVATVIFSLFSGFLATKSNIPKPWIWAYYISYYTWAIRALAQNEMLNVPGLGESALSLYDMQGTQKDAWDNLSYVGYFFIGFTFLTFVGVTVIDFSQSATEQAPNYEMMSEKDKKAQAKMDKMADEADNAVAVDMPADGEDDGSCIEWKELEYVVQVPNGIGKTKPRVLLNKVFGYAKSRQMVALMGTSGAGKTTLLDVLAQQKTGGKITGTLLIDGQPINKALFAQQAGYVEQFDSHEPSATVREAIAFSARLRLPAHITDAEIDKRVKTIIQQLELSTVADSKIGSPESGGITPDARKRTTIAVELVVQPKILFLDEPTTGLDSAGALATMSNVKKLAMSRNMAVICTLHQPSAEIVAMFDTLLLCKPGGQVAYYGPFEELIDYLTKAKLVNPDSMHQNIADVAIDAMSRVKSNGGKNMDGDKIDLIEVYMQSDIGKRTMQLLQDGIAPRSHTVDSSQPHDAGSHDAMHANMWVQTKLLMHRYVTSITRNKPTVISRIFSPLFLSFIIGTLMFQLGTSQTAAAQHVSVIYICMLFMANIGMINLPQSFFIRPTFFRERQANMYSPISYFLATTLGDIPFEIVEVTLFSIMVYWLAGLTPADASARFWLFWVTMIGTRVAGQQFIAVMGGLCNNLATATTLISVIVTVLTLFSGFLIPKSSIGNGWIWMYYLGTFLIH